MLNVPSVFPKIQSRRRAKFCGRGVQDSTIAKDTPPRVAPESCRGDEMLDRLWSGENYVSGRYFHGPSRADPMLNRLWNGQKYSCHAHFRPVREDPMLDRLWNGDKHEKHRTDAMLGRLWNGDRYDQGVGIPQTDVMLSRLWSNAQYPHEKYFSFKHDPMLSRLGNGDKYMSGVYLEEYRDDPMLNRLWNGETYYLDRHASHQDDPMLNRLWNDRKYEQIEYRSPARDPMLPRLWNGARYDETGREVAPKDPMISRLWSATRYRDDPMLDRLWSGESYSGMTERVVESFEVPFTLEPHSPGQSSGRHVSEYDDDSQVEEIDSVGIPQRHSGVFTAFFNSIKTDIPLVNEYLKSQEYANVPVDDDFDEYVQHPLSYHAPDEQHVHFEELLTTESQGYESEEEFPFRGDSTLRIHTQLEDLEAHNHSSGDSSPTTPSDIASHPFQEMHHGTTLPQSWSPPREEVHLSRAMKSDALSQGGNFDQTYPSYFPQGSTVQEDRPSSGRGVGNHFNNVPQNPRLQSASPSIQDSSAVRDKDIVPRSLDPVPRPPSPGFVLSGEAVDSGKTEGRAFLGAFSRLAGSLYYKAPGEDSGRLLGEGETKS